MEKNWGQSPSRKNTNWFRFGLLGDPESSLELLSTFPLKARNKRVKVSQEKALNTILSNIPAGTTLSIRNFCTLKTKGRGYSRDIFLQILKHLRAAELIKSNGKGYESQEIIFMPKIMRYIPKRIVYYPESTIIINSKGEGREVAKINTKERRLLNKRLKAWWEFISQHDIKPGITAHEFNLCNDREVLIFGKPPLVKPKPTDILPNIIYNDRDLTKGGRMYGAFWIGMKKELRRAILIDGSKTCDIDGKGMHVQLLYKSIGEQLPDGDMYLYTDERRKITKGLMLLMMNTASEVSPEVGRKNVIRTYRNRFGHDEGLEDFILELEGVHHKILPLLYRPNWGRLQHTEATIMLNIIEAAMNENIVVLPVHDGCMCKREHREQVLQLFYDQSIEATENKKHLLPIPLEETEVLLKAYSQYEKVA